MGKLQHSYAKLRKSPVVWSWAFNMLRLGSAIILLPLLLRNLNSNELGVHYVLVNMLFLLPTLDAAVAFNLTRFVGHAFHGAKRLVPQGLSEIDHEDTPNYNLLRDIQRAAQLLYRIFGLLVFTAILCYGGFVLSIRIEETANPREVWFALGLTALGAAADIYWSWWTSFMKGMDQMLVTLQYQSLGYGIRIALGATLLIFEFGLLSIPTATLVGGIVQRLLIRKRCLRLLGNTTSENATSEYKGVLRSIYPNSWRMALQLGSQLLMLNFLSYLCIKQLGLEANAVFGFSLQLVMIAASLAGVWSAVKIPLANKLRFKGQINEFRKVATTLFRLQMGTYILMAACVVGVAPVLLDLIGSNTRLLDPALLLILALNQGLDLNFSFWTTLLATENRIPSMKAVATTNCLAMLMSYYLMVPLDLGMVALVVTPLLVGSLFNYWAWMLIAMRRYRICFHALIKG